MPRAGRGTAFGDLDGNGTVDVVINNVHAAPDVWLTMTSAPRHWLVLRLVGTTSNRSAIGARVRVTAGGATQIREVHGGGSYLSHNDMRLHFGLEARTEIDSVDVRWPDGSVQHFTGVRPNSFVKIVEGERAPVSLPVRVVQGR